MMQHQNVLMIIILVVLNGIHPMLMSTRSRTDWETTNRNHTQKESTKANSNISRFVLNFSRTSWSPNINSETNQMAYQSTRQRSVRDTSQIYYTGFPSLFVTENTMSSSTDPSRNSNINSSLRPDLAFDNKIQTEPQNPFDLNTSNNQEKMFEQTQITANSSSRSSTTKQLLTQTVEVTSPDQQTPFISNQLFQTTSRTNFSSKSTFGRAQEQLQTTSVKAENFQQNSISDYQPSQKLSTVKHFQSNPVVTQSRPLVTQYLSRNNQLKSVNYHPNTDNTFLQSSVSLKLRSLPNNFVTVKMSQASSRIDQPNQVYASDSDMSPSQFKDKQSTPVYADASIIYTSPRPPDLLSPSNQNHSKVISHQSQTNSQQIMANHSGTGTVPLNLISNQLTSMPSQVSSNRLQRDTVQPYNIFNTSQAKDNEDVTKDQAKSNSSQTPSTKRVNIKTKKVQPTYKNTRKNDKSHLLRIEFQGPAKQLHNSIIQVQV